jgi:pyrroloquinoline quinone biosynthesis protein B
VPIEGVVLTDAELDHSLGVVLLREARHLPVYATGAVRRVLEEDSRILPVTRAFADVPATDLPLDRAVHLRNRDGSPSGLSVEAFAVPAGPPRFASTEAEGHTVGLLVREEAAGRTCAFVPGCGGLSEPLLARLAGADALLFDGTFWTNDEPVEIGIGTRTAREMDHLPVGGPGGSLERLRELPCRHRVYTHINNTNRMLLEDSAERAAVTGAGLIVGYDGLYITL